MGQPITNFLTFDIEEWFHANYSGLEVPTQDLSAPTHLESLIDRIVEMCREHDVRGTFFILGSVARNKPSIVRKLQAAGHEIASHGHGHELVYSMGPERFRADLKLSCSILENITGERVQGFRAPSFSVTQEVLPWYYDVLEQEGLRYSSSVFPGQTFLYGVSGFPERVHYPVVAGKRRNVLEFPVPAVHILNKQLGLYLRLLPAGMILKRIRKDNRSGKPVILYVHPREIDPHQPRLPLPFLQSLIHYWGINSCESKVRRLMNSCRFGRLCDFPELTLADDQQGLRQKYRPDEGLV